MVKFEFQTLNESRIETFKHVPEELKQRQQWLCYRIDGDDKVPKAPRWTVDGDLHVRNIGVRSNDEWVDFETADAFVQETQEKLPPEESLDGVGFVLTEDDPFVFIDLDHHIEKGEISDFAQEWLDELDSWTEQSSSGDGLHIFVEADDFSMDGYRKKDDELGVEVYTEARFCAMTQDTLSSAPTSVTARVNSLSRLAERYLVKEDSSSEPIEPQWDDESEKDVEKIINTASTFDDTFEALHSGGTVHHDDSHDDISYLTKCFFWAKGNEAVVRDMAKRSRRPRQKWTEPRNGATWFDERIAEAKRFQNDTYDGSYF